MAGTGDISALKVLADVVEPVEDYAREDLLKGPIDFHAPLTHLIDAVYPESEVARKFALLVQRYMQGGAKDQVAEARIRASLTLWRDNDANLQPLLGESPLLREDQTLSQELSQIGAAGLQALDYLDNAQPAPADWKSQELAQVQEAKKAQAALLLMIADPVQQLVEASAGH
jgi:hexosaminidase